MRKNLHNRNVYLCAILLVLAVMFLTSCSTNSDKKGAAGPETTSQTDNSKQENKPPLKVGVLVPLSGSYGMLGENILEGMKLYLDQVDNAAGGREIQLITEDSEMNPDVGLQKARKLIEQDKVDLITGIVNTSVAYAVRDLVHQTQTVLIVSNAGGDKLTREMKSPYVFRTSNSNWQTNYPMGEWVYNNISKEIIVTAADYAAGHEMIDDFKQGFEKAGGKIIKEVYPPLGNTDYSPYLAQISAEKAANVYAFFGGQDAIRFVTQFNEYGLHKNSKLLGAGQMVEEDVLIPQGEAAMGIISGLFWAYGLDNNENKEFVEKYQKTYNEIPSNFGLQGYDTAHLIVEAVNKVNGELQDKQKFLEALKTSEFKSPRGLFAFDPVTQNVKQTIYVREIKKLSDGSIHNVVIDDLGVIVDPSE